MQVARRRTVSAALQMPRATTLEVRAPQRRALRPPFATAHARTHAQASMRTLRAEAAALRADRSRRRLSVGLRAGPARRGSDATRRGPARRHAAAGRGRDAARALADRKAARAEGEVLLALQTLAQLLRDDPAAVTADVVRELRLAVTDPSSHASPVAR